MRGRYFSTQGRLSCCFSFRDIDEPDAAERCLRRALSGAAAADDDAALAGGNGAERHTRRRLADVLKATEADAGAAADAPKPSQYKRVVKAIETANDRGGVTLAICGYDGGKVKQLAQHALHVPSFDMQICEDVHFIFGHMVMKSLCDDHIRD